MVNSVPIRKYCVKLDRRQIEFLRKLIDECEDMMTKDRERRSFRVLHECRIVRQIFDKALKGDVER